MKNRFIIVLLLLTGIYAFANDSTTSEIDTSAVSDELNQKIMLARSSADYRVTPGDVYTLSYAIGNNPVIYVILVDSSYRIRVSNLGVVNGDGKTFMQLKNEVETLVTRNYPLSGVQLVLTQPAVFKIFINGEVRNSGEKDAWGLSRLSSLLTITAAMETSSETATPGSLAAFATTSDILTDYASIRNITIKSSNGQVRVYDLFKAQRNGDISQDPYLRPGDTVTFNHIDRVVNISGAVKRPGTYELLPNENLTELINIYGNGFAPLADLSKLELFRLINKSTPDGIIFLTEENLTENYTLESYDSITVPSFSQIQSVMFVETAAGVNSTLVTASSRMIVRFSIGETYTSLVRKNPGWVSNISDNENAYVLRKSERIPLNLNHILYDASERDSILVEEDDVLVIPFKQYFVTVSGAVVAPGRYPYIPDRNWEYYVNLAGGFVPNRNAFGAVSIFDINRKRMRKTDQIMPETTVDAKSNHFLYQYSQYGPVVTTMLATASTLLSIMLIVQR